MKRMTLVFSVLVLVVGMVFAAGGQQSDGAASDWKPTRTIEWHLGSDPGGGNDIFTRAMIEILNTKGISDANFTINYNKDGDGEVVKMLTSRATGVTAAHTLLGVVCGDVPSMIRAGNHTLDDFIPLAITASETELFLVSKNSPYKSVDDIVAAIKGGKKMSITGGGYDDQISYLKLIDSIGVTEEDITLIRTRANPESLTMVMGGHVEICISKASAALPYLESGDMIPIAVAASNRLPSAPFNAAPTLGELGYKNIDNPVWRAIYASANMPKEAVDYYVRIFKEMTETPEWQVFLDSINASRIDGYIGEEKARPFIKDYEDYIRSAFSF